MKVTQLQMVWEYLSTRGTLTAHEIARGMGKDLSSVTSELFKLCQQGQAYREKSSYINDNAHKVSCYKYTTKGVKYIHGRTLAAMQRRALREKAKRQMELPLAAPEPVAEKARDAVAPVTVAVTPETKVRLSVDDMTVREARDVYKQLKEFFNGMN